MRGGLGFVGFVASLVIAGCGDSSSTGYGTKGLGGASSSQGREGDGNRDDNRDGNRDDNRDDNGDGTLDGADAGSIEGTGGDASSTNADDTDGDGVPNADDCDPSSKSLKRRIVEDTLGADKGLFAAAAGFPATSWTFANVAAYQQTRLVDATTSDVSFFTKDSAIGDVQIEVTTASTEVSSAITPRLRQIFVVVGATSGGTFKGTGCGIEVVQGESPEQKTSIVKLEGPPSNVTTTVLQRVTRPAVQANEELSVKLRLEDGAMICDVSQAGGVMTTATASGLGALQGSIGFFTHQTKALFENVRVCSLK